MIIGRSLITALISFMGGAPREAVRPVRKFSVWDVNSRDRALFNIEIKSGPNLNIAVREVMDKTADPHQIVGVTIFFPLIHPVIESLGEEDHPLGYLCQTQGHAVCYDAAGGRPVLHETEESFQRRNRESIASGLVFSSPDLPGLTIEGQSGRLIGNRFYPMDASPSEEGTLTFCFTANAGNRTARIGYAATPNFDLVNLITGQADFLQPVFDPQSFIRGGNFDLSRARLVGLVERGKGDTTN